MWLLVFVYSLCLVCHACFLLFFVACFVLECLLGWTGSSFVMWFLSLSVVYFLYYLEYRVVGVDVCLIHLQSISAHLLYIYISSVLRCFLSVFKTFIVSVILPYVYLAFSVCFEYPELPLLFLIACICSLYVVLNIRPGCPIYFNSPHYNKTTQTKYTYYTNN
jgi:hypothetical protein